MTTNRDPSLRYDELAIKDRNTGYMLFQIVAVRPPGMSDAQADRQLREMVEHIFPGASVKCSSSSPLIVPGRH